MKAFFDTNVLVAAVTTDTDRSQAAIDLLSGVEEGYTSIVNLIELRSVLAKKKPFERDRIERIEDRIARNTTVVFPDASDIVTAKSRQREALLYPLVSIGLAAAESVDLPCVSSDGQPLGHESGGPSGLLRA